MKVSPDDLKRLIEAKLHLAGLAKEQAAVVADVLVFADIRGVHSHGAMRVEYYAERIAKGGINVNPQIDWQVTGACTAICDGDNGVGHYMAKLAMDEAINIAAKNGVAVVGVRNISHSGAVGYFVKQAVERKMIGISVCQSDPMVVPYGGTDPYYGTNPIAFGAPSNTDEAIIFDMATSVQAWGKILHARSKHEAIPPTWAVDDQGVPTTDPFKVHALLPIADAKGYGLMMMVDILSGVLLGLPFGNKVSSMYADLSAYRRLGQLHVVINPSFFTDLDQFLANITQTMRDLNNMRPAPGFDMVYYPGQREELKRAEYTQTGIEIVDSIFEYLVSDVIHHNFYDHKDPFAE
ncbi:MAG: ureidoglycolate dehydrogenase [Sulfobacillus acidophilus]|uniref:Ureidoglycolate dehydrogenase n=1 Tax=Sulfobacillus acidophilus TaxID=53633 RepID=A0A2T2WH35_9FIRM|nr:MAG: ureidoglycolate dehydrogenase [Sulfobacillus acidophilus]